MRDAWTLYDVVEDEVRQDRWQDDPERYRLTARDVLDDEEYAELLRERRERRGR